MQILETRAWMNAVPRPVHHSSEAATAPGNPLQR